MLKNFCSAKTFAILFFSVLVINSVNAQQPQATAGQINALVQNNLQAIQLSSTERENTRISDAYYSKQSGLTLVYLQQTYKGIDVYNSLKVLAFKNDKLVSEAGGIITTAEAKANNKAGAPALMPDGAVIAAARHLNLPPVQTMKPQPFVQGTKKAAFTGLGIARDSIHVKLMWMPVDDDQRLVLCWQVEIQPNKTSDYWLVRVDAASGAIINKDNLTVKCTWNKPGHVHTADCYEVEKYDDGNAGAGTFKDPATINSAKYRVIPFPAEAPTFPGGTPTLVTNPWLLTPAGSPATSLKWNDNGNTSFAITRGNNVYAQEDHDANDNTLGKTAKSKTPLPDLDFDYNPFFDGEPQDSLNLGFALTNLFYWSNIMHDLSYQYGFDEVAGNFQQNNQGRGGLGNDHVIADGQDAVDINNSNFATPPDGQNPRMQMFLFTYDQGKIALVNSPAALQGYKPAAESDFSTKNKLVDKGPITANLALYKEAGGTSRGCDPASNAASLKGKIALMYRGNCNFVDKVKNAQNAGAIAVVMVDTVPNELVTMSGSDNTITIPALMVTLADGDAIKNALNGGTQVNMTLKAQHFLDGSLDAGVMSHEYTHGISNRLTGGPSNTSCLLNKEQMGEGWSDYFALMTTTDWAKATINDGVKPRPLGTYVVAEQPTDGGIRNFPYSTDMTIDPWTYDMLESNTGGEAHNIGEIWCTVLWDMTWNIIQQDNVINTKIFNADKDGGNTVALKLVTEGMKLQPCSPGFIDGRDAILRADTLLYNGKYSCAIWKAFAKRGMGVKASQGSSKSYQDQEANYSIPATPLLSKHVNFDTASQGATLTYNITSTCKCAPLTNVKIVDTLAPSITWLSGGSYNNTDRTVTFTGINLAASQSSNVTVKVKINDGTYFAPVKVFTDSVKTGSIPAGVWQNQSSTGTGWDVSSTQHKTNGFSYFAYDSSKKTTESLVTKNAFQLKGASTLSFWHLYNTEDGFDGGVVELSTDDGTSWVDLGPYITRNGYTKRIGKNSASSLANRLVFTGNSGTFINTLVNLSTFAGKKVMIRFTFATDDINKGTGWFIDDITIDSKASVYNRVQLLTAADSLENSADTITAISSKPLPVTWGDFVAEKADNAAHLTWTTMEELNTDKFVIERSGDGAAFYPIGTVKAAGNSSFSLHYQFNDGKPLQGKNYYRLQQFDKDGKFQYSAVRMLTFGGRDGSVSLSPNPAKDKVGVTVTGNTKALKVLLVNNLGQQMGAFDMNGEYLEINLATVAAGVYYIKIEGEGVSTKQKLIVK